MASVVGSVRRLLLAPELADVSFRRRGFPATPSATTERLEAVPRAVICGFEWGLDTRDQWELERRVELVEEELRGFAYEGATMACTVLDALPGRSGRTRALLLGPGQPHLFLAYIGIGFAMARLPRPLWRGVLPDLDGIVYHPTMSWLAVDGYGFDRAYFDTVRVVDRQERLAAYPWQGAAEYFPRAVDQGIGRALWFIHGGRVPNVAAAVGRFAAERQPDLWSGVGLAATFAGGCDAGPLHRAAGGHASDLAQGAVFAAKARSWSGCVPEHTRTALVGLTGLTVEAAVGLADEVAVTGPIDGQVPPYEMWRNRVRARFLATSARS
ncbi:DUF1702 family protein [Salinispora tropica]|uniref:Enediyne biosynthesis protein n=1 Tax=Salinispora tropica (strain ATCC BAA-916 / DSM 44818 / JCM 13857 / NBRC 105044 / CNB-440) TaxID=369723 RepID=A4X8E5_SALTO|nr:DUF1702 family protein [Salinispora tropica]ABP55145.1 protein of unknown function DUF1702 [Salinispora tropica CNB-440]